MTLSLRSLARVARNRRAAEMQAALQGQSRSHHPNPDHDKGWKSTRCVCMQWLDEFVSALVVLAPC